MAGIRATSVRPSQTAAPHPRDGDSSMTAGDQSVLVVDLAQLGVGDLDHGGGKAANLGELLRTGSRSPRVVITTTAYDLMVRSNELQHDIVAASSRGDAALVRTGFESDDSSGSGTGHPRRLPPHGWGRRRPLERDGGGLATGGIRRPAGDISGGERRTALLDAVRRCWASSGAIVPSPTASSTDWRRCR